MALARVFTNLGSLIIKKLRDTGGPPSDRVSQELDNIIAWAKLSPRCIHRNTSTVGNVGVGLDTLHTFSLPAGSLAVNGDYLNVWYGGDFATNDNDKRLTFSFGGTGYEDTGARDLDVNVGWTFMARIIRLSSTSVLVSHLLCANLMGVTGADVLVGFATGAYSFARNTPITGLADLGANATTMLVQGEATANDDVFQNLSIIELTQQ